MRTCDAVVIGSGINSLVAAALLSRHGWDVIVVEQSSQPGGAIRTSDLTLPGFHHEEFSSFHPQFVGSPAFRELAPSLKRLGVRYLNTDVPTAVVSSTGESAALSRSTAITVSELEHLHKGDGEAVAHTLERLRRHERAISALMGLESSSVTGIAHLLRSAAPLKLAGVAGLGQDTLEPARAWLNRAFQSPLTRSLLAPWGLHAGLGPDDAGSALTTRLIVAALLDSGCPVPEGGGTTLVNALTTLVTEAGGSVTCDSDVDEVVVDAGRATGIRTVDGTRIQARRAVLASVTPTALYGRLLREARLPADVRESSQRFRYGNGCMMVHLAMSAPPSWRNDNTRLSKAAVVHVNAALGDISLARTQATNGALPSRPMIAFGQPVALDPSRAPVGSSIAWIQLLDTPYAPRNDAAGRIRVDGAWTSDVRERYADRVMGFLAQDIENLESATLERRCMSPLELEALNPNMVNGDPYSGATQLDQSMIYRPNRRGHRTPIDRLWHLGASTHPGPGLGAGSGWIVAQALMKKSRAPWNRGR